MVYNLLRKVCWVLCCRSADSRFRASLRLLTKGTCRRADWATCATRSFQFFPVVHVPPLGLPGDGLALHCIKMHELAITENILEVAKTHAAPAGARKVLSLTLSIGQLSGFVEESVRFCWELLTQGTICEGANLIIRQIPAELHCLECGEKFGLTHELIPCPVCASARIRIAGGEEMQIDSIEIETD